MDEEKGINKILKWAGIAALIALPVLVLLRKRKVQESETNWDDESNIFAAELEE
ncbi:MAG: hypothetical protein QME52_03020 [Bacteroidota bacterium]|nr:hypothetical protein [Bacteroidota bacterium]